MSPTRKASQPAPGNTPEPAQATRDEAAARADNVRQILIAGWDQFGPILSAAFAHKDWIALGHVDFSEYMAQEYHGWLPQFTSIGERATVIKELVAGGMSQRAAGEATGTSGATVNRTLHVPDETPSEPSEASDQDGSRETKQEKLYRELEEIGRAAQAEEDKILRAMRGLADDGTTQVRPAQILAWLADHGEPMEDNALDNRMISMLDQDRVIESEPGIRHSLRWDIRHEALYWLTPESSDDHAGEGFNHDDLLRAGATQEQIGDPAWLAELNRTYDERGHSKRITNDSEAGRLRGCIPHIADYAIRRSEREEQERSPETPLPPDKEARKQAHISRKALRRLIATQGVTADGARRAKALLDEEVDELADAREFLAVIAGESPAGPEGLSRFDKYAARRLDEEDEEDDAEDAEDA